MTLKEKLAEEHLDKIHYDPFSGVFFWTRDVSIRCKGITPCGLKPKFYPTIKLGGNIMKAHRLAWRKLYGVWPKKNIDHINGDPSDNRIENLREASFRENGLNRKEHRNGKLPYCTWKESLKKWESYAYIGRKRIYLGVFPTMEQASRVGSDFMNKGDL